MKSAIIEAAEYIEGHARYLREFFGPCELGYEAERIAQRLRAEASGWQPIETAPKDGTWFLATEDGEVDLCAWHKTPHVPLYGFHFHSCDPEDAEECHPTHWMPLPAPPAVKESLTAEKSSVIRAPQRGGR